MFIFPTLLFASTLQKPPNNLGLVGYWSFNEATGTIAHDASGQGNYGTLNTFSAPATASSGWGSGKVGSGLNFDGSSDYVTIGTIDILNVESGQFTVSAWVKLNSYPANDQSFAFISKGQSNVGGWGFEYYKTGETLYLDLVKFGVVDQNVAKILNLGVWYHLVAVQKTGSVDYYVDGQFYGTYTNATAYNSASSHQARIGADSNNVSFLNGASDEVRVYNRALSATEVSALYKSGSAKVGTSKASNVTNGLVGWWSFDGGDMTSTLAYDRSGAGNNGTLVSGPSRTLGKLGQALLFSSSLGNYVNAGAGVPLTSLTEISVCAWIYSTAAVQSDNGIVSKSNTAGNMLYFWLGHSGSAGNQISFYTKDVWLESGTAVVPFQWTFVCGTAKNGERKIYLNATVTASDAGSVDLSSSGPVELSIGAMESSRNFNGKIDDVRIYNRALSQSEINSLYNLGGSKVNSSQANPPGTSLGSGLVGYWSFNGTDVTDKVYDRSGQGNNGYLYNGATSTAKVIGKMGQALNFDGTDDFVKIGTPASLDFNGTNQITMSAWVYPTAVGSWPVIVAKQDGNGGQYNFQAGYNNDLKPGLYLNVGAWGNKVQSLTALTLNKWTHVVTTYDGSNAKIYLNGSLNNSASLSGNMSADGGNVYIGMGNIVPYVFPGKLDEVRIYTRALSAEEIKQMYLLGR